MDDGRARRTQIGSRRLGLVQMVLVSGVLSRLLFVPGLLLGQGQLTPGAVTNTLTFHIDRQRTGWSPNETILTQRRWPARRTPLPSAGQ